MSTDPSSSSSTSKKRKTSASTSSSSSSKDPTPQTQAQAQAQAQPAAAKDETRKLAQASRTLKACELCRKQKTRCFRSPENPNSCLRCRFLNKTCSFENDASLAGVGGMLPFNLSNQETTKKLDAIHDGISEILTCLRSGGASGRNEGGTGSGGVGRGGRTEDAKLLLDASARMRRKSGSSLTLENDLNFPQFKSFRTLAESSPFAIMLDLFDDGSHRGFTNNVEGDDDEGEEDETVMPLSENVLTLGILTEREVVELISNFRRNYGRWVSFPSSIPTENLINLMQARSSLLLTSCCLVALRYQTFEDSLEKALKYYMLVQQLMKDLNTSFVKYTSIGSMLGQVEFLQAITIISIYLVSISKLESSIKLDPWLLSNIGLSTFITKTALGEFKEVDDERIRIHRQDYDKVMIMRIYNHLCLAHIVNSIFSGRICIIDSARVQQTATTLSLLKATNFDGRMVSEIGLLFIAYNYLQGVAEVDGYQHLDSLFDQVVNDIKEWFVQWEYLFTQPALHFLEFNYNFCSMFVYYVYCFQRLKLLGEVGNSSTVLDHDVLSHVFKSIDNEDILLTMFDYCLLVLSHINNIDNDSYFAYLSDQIHFIFYFCGIFMIKLHRIMLAKEMLPTKDKNKGVKNVQQLINKFDKISADHPEDVLFTYKMNLEACLNENT
ncbi:Transcriptional activator of proteases prtT [Candida viswanathii]|uniref:Transcriptional activator of proteases prtT n=1 Tax=Candida viswanathii TaxID=5486 RepID=A0A367Y9X4_9ASCO|nr:Transcriptional activator of proteases prtT [Candida viswanathii]